jgi:hypothetical protein
MNIPEQYLIKDPNKLVKGQKLWLYYKGDCEFQYYNNGKIHVDCKGTTHVLNETGRDCQDDLLPVLFLSNPFEPQERVILVSDDKVKWHTRVLIKFIEDRPVVWWSGETIEEAKKEPETVFFDFWKEITPQEEEKEEMISIKALKQMGVTQFLELLKS